MTHIARHAASRTDRAMLAIEDEDYDELSDLFGSDELELTASAQTGCFRLGCAGKRILLDELGG